MNRKPKTKKLAGLAATMQRSTSIMEAIRPKVYTEEFVNLHESMIREDEVCVCDTTVSYFFRNFIINF